jgi:uncharacterized protein
MIEFFKVLEKYNFWDGKSIQTGFSRSFYLDKIRNFMGNRLVKVLMGQRRAGKSYILRQIIDQLILSGTNPKNIFYLNKEQFEFDKIAGSNELIELISFYRKTLKIEGKVFLFLDEVQEITGWEKCIISYAHDNVDEYEVFVTGSNSHMLSTELATYLSGRYIAFEILPFSFSEYAKALNLEKNRESLLKYLGSGGLPELLNLNDPEAKYHYLLALKDSILLNDVVKKYGIKDIALLESLFKFMIDSVGSFYSVNSLVGHLKSNARESNFETISNYTEYLCRSLLVHKCEKYDIRGKQRLGGNAKYYLNDLSFKEYFSSSFDPGLTRRLENGLYLHYRAAGYKVYVGSVNGQEVDFVVEKNSQEREYVQVCYLLESEEVVKREFGSLEKIKDNHPKTVISMDEGPQGNRNGIRHMRAWDVM